MRAVGLTMGLAALIAVAPASAQVFGTNLVVNGDAEASTGGSGEATGAPGFTTTTGGLAVIRYDVGGGYPGTGDLGVTAANGANLFGGGYDGVTVVTQRITLGAGASSIDAGGSTFNLSGLLGGFSGQDDNVTVALAFVNASDLALGGGLLGPVLSIDRASRTGFVERALAGLVPTGTRFADLTLTFTRAQGSSNDGYLDNLSLILDAGTMGGVPEPASWALMILGFGTIGGLLRRRRSAGGTLRYAID